jgi:MFS family permease
MLARASCMLLAGVVVDRVSPRRVMMAINGLRAILGASLTALVVLDLLSLWQLYVFGIGFGLLDAFFQPAFLAIPPQLVAADELPPANALLQATRRACEMLGPALGGLVLKLSGAERPLVPTQPPSRSLRPCLPPSAAMHRGQRARTVRLPGKQACTGGAWCRS